MADPTPQVFFPSWNPQDQSEAAPDTEKEPPIQGIYVDSEEPETAGAPDAFSSLYAPEFYRGLIDAATFLVDIPTMGAGYALGKGAEALGFDETAKKFKNPILLSDVVKGGFEAPARIEEAITGEAPVYTAGFDATPRKARNPRERFFRDIAYISGGGVSFPTALGAVYGTLRAPVSKLLSDAAGRGVNSEAARRAIDAAVKTKDPNALKALSDSARQYAARFTSGLGTRTSRTLAGEQTLATAAGLGYAAPELGADDDGKIMMDIGEGEVDVAPTLKILSSMGLPIALAHTPSGIALGGGDKVLDLLRYVRNKSQVFAKSLLGGFTESGRKDMAARIFNQMESEPGVLENVLLPAIEAGQFRTPGNATPIKILEDGTVVPEYGGISPDTVQALKILGYDDTRLAMLDQSLRGRGTNLQVRLEEEARRAKLLDDSFELLRSHLGSGDEAAAYRAIEKARNNLDDEALDAVETAVARARDVFEALEPSIGRAEASKAAVDMLESARLESREVTRKLFDKELIGTEYVDTRQFGDWAISVIREMGERNLPVMSGMGDFYKLAGKKRLQEAGLLPSGKPITDADLGGVKGTGDELLRADEIPDQGLYDIFGDAGTIYAEPVRIETVQNFRSEIGDKARAAYKAGNAKLGKRFSLIIDYIDNEILAAKNFEGKVAPENIRNIEVGRQYVLDAKARFGPNSEIGKLLFKGDDIVDEGFLNRLIKAGPESGARVELFRNALNEPQQVVQGSDVTWQRDPAASLTAGDNPNVIEAELLLRYTEGLAGGAVTQKNVDRFVTKYGEAIDKIPGLREKFNDLKAVQAAADAMTSKLTVPNRETVLSAIREGATLDDIANARRILRENFEDRQLANTASEYLDADVNQAASAFINADPENAGRRANEIDALLAKDETGQAARGFRAALWRSLRESSRRVGPDGEALPGVDSRKLANTVEKNRPYLEKFYDKSSMEFLDELVKGGPLQTTGTGVPTAGSPRDVMRAEFGTVEAVGAIGRTAGQKIFGVIGINPLVATGMGRRIAAYTFTRLGEEAIMKNVEDALRDPEKAAVLIRRYKNLDKFEPPEKVKRMAEEAVDDLGKFAGDTALGALSTAKDRLSRAAGFAGKYLQGHSKEAVERAVRFGLIPAQAESRRMTLEEDYKYGPPFVYEDNRIRYAIENNPDYTEAPPPPPQRPITAPANYPPGRGPIPASGLSQISPVPARPPGPASPSTVSRMNELGIPLFNPQGFNHGGYADKNSGIMSIKCKPQQIVG
tara:strand:- start:30 stop:3815 length:3786 start_codon:yes stop_codon:yes gene_type:complete